MTKHLGRNLMAGLCLLSTSAFANVIDFDFTTPSIDLVTSKDFSAGGISATATAWSLTTSHTYAQGTLLLSPFGLGVDNAGNDDSLAVDNGPPTTGWDDFVRFSFSQAVTVTRVSVYPFGDIDVSYSFDASNNDWISQSVDFNGFPSYITLNVQKLSQIFSLGAMRGDNNDEFTIAGLRLQTTARAVPEPGTLALLGAGLVGLGLIRRRKTD